MVNYKKLESFRKKAFFVLIWIIKKPTGYKPKIHIDRQLNGASPLKFHIVFKARANNLKTFIKRQLLKTSIDLHFSKKNFLKRMT